ncbi:MAG: NAD-dependent epimerase/dehydratase [Nitrospirae bacterium]|nr:NAD-dependent epimerase/dehydratase [Nitrospirota bacterium]
MTDRPRRVLVTGGGGYVGARLVPQLVERGHRVRVLDLFLYGEDVFDGVASGGGLECVRGDLRDAGLLARALEGCDAVIHLACISNDPSFELDPVLGRSINYEAFPPLVRLSKEKGVRRFIYASTSSVYGVSDSPEVTEEHPLVPLTDYSRYKALCEPILLEQAGAGFVPVVIRPATVCGYSRRMRLDLTVNILTAHAVQRRIVTVFGGDQTRPNIHIQDMVDLYTMLLDMPDERVARKVLNAGCANHRVSDLARMVKTVVEEERPDGGPITIETRASDDKRSYRITSDRIRKELGFVTRHSIEDAVREVARAIGDGRISDPLGNQRYYNIRTMQAVELK